MLHCINDIALLCNSRKITIDYSVYNTNSTAIVPAAQLQYMQMDY
jgi:hypothetical protein